MTGSRIEPRQYYPESRGTVGTRTLGNQTGSRVNLSPRRTDRWRHYLVSIGMIVLLVVILAFVGRTRTGSTRRSVILTDVFAF
jgi:hypothetical protein